MTGPAARPAIFFDRDGVINEDRGYVGDVSRFVFLPGAVAAVRAANRRGALAFLVTNQSGVARGFYTEADVAALHAHMAREMAREGARFDEIRYCPHLPDAPVAAYRRDCDCRKPAPGMIRDLLSRWPAAPARTQLRGGPARAGGAARAAGLRGVLCRGEPLEAIVTGFLDAVG